MGYDESHDPLIAYRVDKNMETRRSMSVHIEDSLTNLDARKSYGCDIKYLYEDYGRVYFCDSFNCVPCESMNPLRFL